jgi:hypothetical protein
MFFLRLGLFKPSDLKAATLPEGDRLKNQLHRCLTDAVNGSCGRLSDSPTSSKGSPDRTKIAIQARQEAFKAHGRVFVEALMACEGLDVSALQCQRSGKGLSSGTFYEKAWGTSDSSVSMEVDCLTTALFCLMDDSVSGPVKKASPEAFDALNGVFQDLLGRLWRAGLVRPSVLSRDDRASLSSSSLSTLGPSPSGSTGGCL